MTRRAGSGRGPLELAAGLDRDRRRRARLRGRRITRVGIAAIVFAVALSTTLGLLGQGAPRRALAEQHAVELHAAHDASYVPVARGDGPLFILALGSDARPGQNVLRERADSIHIIGVDRRRERATILGFPRDSWVPIPGHGRGKINSAMSIGGPTLMVRTVESLTGIRMDYWMLTSFRGLSRMVDAVGGLVLDVPYAMNDPASHANLSKGVQRLKGWQALAFARNRKDTPQGDFSRSLNQGRLFLAALAQLRSEFRSDPGRLLTWMVTGSRNLHTDLAFDTLLDLAITASQVPPSAVNNLVAPGSSGWVGSASVVFLSGRASGMYADMRADGVVG
jgi:LCP family protein required for cell wall assembly